MFGKKRAKIHNQATLLMNEWNAIFNAAGNNLDVDIDEDNELEIMSFAINLQIAILGILVYYVAGLNHLDTAQEMIEQYKKLIAQYDESMNPNQVTVEEAELFVNMAYQKAREISEDCMSKGEELDVIVHKHAQLAAELSGVDDTENNIKFFENAFNIFYTETYQKYYG